MKPLFKCVITKDQVINFYIEKRMISLNHLTFGKAIGSIWLPIAFLFLFVFQSQGQINYSGKQGLMHIPTAEVLPDGTFSMASLYVPQDYAFRRPGYFNQIFVASLTVIPRISIHFQLNRAYPIGNRPPARQGIGERQLDLSYLLLQEKKIRPALVLALTAPFSVFSPTASMALVASKNYTLGKIKLQPTMGFGLPFDIVREPERGKNNDLFNQFQVTKKASTDYLSGPFAGFKVSYQNRFGLMGEYTGNTVHVGGYLKIANRLTLQSGYLGNNKWTFAATFQTSLLKKDD